MRLSVFGIQNQIRAGVFSTFEDDNDLLCIFFTTEVVKLPELTQRNKDDVKKNVKPRNGYEIH